MTYTVTLKASGRQFEVRADEAILDGAQRAGLALPYSCRSGLCGSCKATVLEGTFHYPHWPPTALSVHEQAERAVLLCQAVPKSDMVLAVQEVRSVEDMPRRHVTVTLQQKTQVSPQVVCLRLAQNDGQPRLRWLPGQFVNVVLENGNKRPFSIARAPHLGRDIEIHVRHIAGGGFSSYAFKHLQEGATLHLHGPQGTFVPREDSERPMIMVAGGTGIAPIKALIEHFMHLHTLRPIHLYWGAQTLDELYLLDTFVAWSKRAPHGRFTPVVVKRDSAAASVPYLRQGLVPATVLDDNPDLSDFDIYMCGPPGLIDVGRSAFVKAGVPEDRLYFDSFEYAPDVLNQILGNRAGIHGL